MSLHPDSNPVQYISLSFVSKHVTHCPITGNDWIKYTYSHSLPLSSRLNFKNSSQYTRCGRYASPTASFYVFQTSWKDALCFWAVSEKPLYQPPTLFTHHSFLLVVCDLFDRYCRLHADGDPTTLYKKDESAYYQDRGSRKLGNEIPNQISAFIIAISFIRLLAHKTLTEKCTYTEVRPFIEAHLYFVLSGIRYGHIQTQR